MKKLLVGVLAVSVVVGIFFMTKNDAEAPAPEQAESTSPVTTSTRHNADAYKNFEPISPEDWEYTAKAEEIINETQGNNPGTERIVGEIVHNPFPLKSEEENPIYYFATQSALYLPPPADTGDLFVGIYQYDVSSHNWERLYKTGWSYDYDNPRPGDVLSYNLLGWDNENLILQITDESVETDECSSLWLMERKIAEDDDHEPEDHGHEEALLTSGLLAMDVHNPYGGFTPYELPEDVREQKLSALPNSCAD